jgi:anaerobic selenocysteine-containing dehydrogenase
MNLSVMFGTNPYENENKSKVGVMLDRSQLKKKKNKLHGLSPRANYTDRATAAYRRSDCQLVRIEGAT